jgi:hypothetical protein
MNPPAPTPGFWTGRRVVCAAGVLGLLWYLAIGGAPSLDPTNLDPVGSGDHSQHVLGWLLLRNEPWSFPLGRVSALLHPLGGSVAFTDSNPWVSVLLKPLSGVLPRDFQFVGLWLALCFVLQGVFAVLLVGTLTERPLARLAGAALFILSPALLFRLGHDTLSAHWMLLALLWLHLRPCPDARRARGSVAWVLALNLLAAGVHPYLAVMVFTLGAALLVRLGWRERVLSARGTGLALVSSAGAVVLPFVAFGYVGGRAELATPDDFGRYSADLLTLVNPMDHSAVLPALPTLPGQYEGFGFLGTGVLALGVVGLGLGLRRRREGAREPSRVSWPLVTAMVLLTLLALSWKVTLAGHTVLTARSLLRPLTPLFEPLRASGRFIWPLHYLALLGAIALGLRGARGRPGVAGALLVGAVVVQAADLPGAWSGRYAPSGAWPRLRDAAWTGLGEGPYRHLVLFPPLATASLSNCGDVEFSYADSVRFGDLAYRERLTVNSGYLARRDERGIQAYCDALRADVAAGRFARDAVYVVHPQRLDLFTRAGSGMVCGLLEGYRVCVAADVPSPLREALTSGTRRP